MLPERHSAPGPAAVLQSVAASQGGEQRHATSSTGHAGPPSSELRSENPSHDRRSFSGSHTGTPPPSDRGGSGRSSCDSWQPHNPTARPATTHMTADAPRRRAPSAERDIAHDCTTQRSAHDGRARGRGLRGSTSRARGADREERGARNADSAAPVDERRAGGGARRPLGAQPPGEVADEGAGAARSRVSSDAVFGGESR